MYRRMVCLLFGLAFGAYERVRAQDKPFAEVEILRGEHVSELSVYIVNPGLGDFEFLTGARGRGGDVPQGAMAGSSTGLTVVPRLTFQWNPPDGHKPPASRVELRAPIFSATWEYRTRPQPEIFVVGPGKRRFYYAFKVPTEYVRGKFVGGYLPRPDLKNKTPGYGTRPEMIGAIPITRLIDTTDKNAMGKDEENP